MAYVTTSPPVLLAHEKGSVDEQAGVSSLSPCLAGGVGGVAAVLGVIQPPGGEPGVDRVCVRDDRRGVVRENTWNTPPKNAQAASQQAMNAARVWVKLSHTNMCRE